MTIALIATSPMTVLKTWPQGPINLNIAGKWQADGVDAGYATPDGAYRVVAVTPFAVPAGQVAVGEPSYSIDARGNVTETYATQAAPAPPPPSFLARDLMLQLTPADYTAIKTAIQDNDALGLLWSSLLAQGDNPIATDNAQFQAGWAGITQALGADRTAQIATALGLS